MIRRIVDLIDRSWMTGAVKHVTIRESYDHEHNEAEGCTDLEGRSILCSGPTETITDEGEWEDRHGRPIRSPRLLAKLEGLAQEED